MRPFSALKHLVYFETLAETEENTPHWNSTTAGLVVLRLLDTWVDFGAVSLRENARGIKNIRAAIDSIGEGSPVRKILHGLLESVERAKHPDMSGIIPRLMAYGRALDYEGSWKLSNDVYQTVLDYAPEAEEPDVVIDAHMQMGYCQRMMGQWEGAAHSYAQAGQVASAQGDIERVLRARIADAKLAIDRGNLPQAEALLDDTIMQARAAAGLTEVRSLALHERATVAYMRGQFESSVKLGYDALEGLQNPTARDRVLSDIAASFGELGVLSAARDALVIVAATAQELYLRWVAEINLLEIAAKQREEPAFEMYRRELADAELPASLLAHYHLFVGHGHQVFGKLDMARASLERALAVASQHKFNQIVFEAEKALQGLERAEVEEEEVHTEPTPEIAKIAQAISDMRVAAGIGG
jgi:tetratricopeptide (TPR) repeat protein